MAKLPDQPFMGAAANGSKEPKVYFESSRCVHSQRQKCRASKTFGAAAQRKEQSFL